MQGPYKEPLYKAVGLRDQLKPELVTKPIEVGQSIKLVPIERVRDFFNLTNKEVLHFLKTLSVPFLSVGKTLLFNFNTFEEALYALLEQGAPGIKTSGGTHFKDAYSEYAPPTELPEEYLGSVKRSSLTHMMHQYERNNRGPDGRKATLLDLIFGDVTQEDPTRPEEPVAVPQPDTKPEPEIPVLPVIPTVSQVVTDMPEADHNDERVFHDRISKHEQLMIEGRMGHILHMARIGMEKEEAIYKMSRKQRELQEIRDRWKEEDPDANDQEEEEEDENYDDSPEVFKGHRPPTEGDQYGLCTDQPSRSTERKHVFSESYDPLLEEELADTPGWRGGSQKEKPDGLHTTGGTEPGAGGRGEASDDGPEGTGRTSPRGDG